MNDSRKIRMEAISDGVLAIAITLLALELKIPHLGIKNFQESFIEIIPLIPGVLTFILSFVSIAIFWVNHNHLTQHIKKISGKIIWANTIFLMSQTLIPFATRLISENPQNVLSVLIYSIILFICSSTFAVLHYIIHKDDPITRNSFERSLIGPLFYVGAIFATFVSIWISYLFLIIPLVYYFIPRSSKKEEDYTWAE